jgi:hypothetical protein
MEDFIGLAMWRHEEVQQSEARRVALLIVFGCLFSWLLMGYLLSL